MFRSVEEGGGSPFDVACGWHYYDFSEKQGHSSSGAPNTSMCYSLMLDRIWSPGSELGYTVNHICICIRNIIHACLD